MIRRSDTHRLPGAHLAIAIAALASGCAFEGGGPADPPDLPDAAGQGDGGDGGDGGDAGGDSGVTFEFDYVGNAGADIEPGDGEIVFPDFKITRMTMQLHRMELVGDTASPGDLVWRSRVLDFPLTSPPRVPFTAAPPGLYSRFHYRVERTYSDEEPPPHFGERLSIKVEGVAFVAPAERPFEYIDDKHVDIDLKFTKEVAPGMAGLIEIELDVASWFEGLDWQALADDEDGDDGDDDNSGPGGGDDDDGDDDGGSGGDVIHIGMDGNDEAGRHLRENLKDSFRAVL